MKNVLLDKGIILPSGEISKDKVNLLRLSDYETNNKASIRQVTTQK